MENKTTMAVLALGIIALLGTGMVFAYQGDPNTLGPNYSEERHAAMQNAFDNMDYNSWYQLMSENERHGRILDVINEDNFETFIKARNAMIEGDSELAQELKSELGLGQGKMIRGEGKAQGMRGQGFNQDGSNRAFGTCPYFN